jgi:glutamyl-tRNA reductase
MILGEAQILGQVKKAYQRAIEVGSVGSHLHHIFQSAFNVAKKVRAHTDVSQHGVSVSYVAVRLAEQIFSDLDNTTVLILGSGEMAELAALHLCSRGCRRIIVANRTVEKAAELAERFGGSAVSLSDVDRVLDQADIVIGSISIDKPILSRSALRARKGDRPLFLIDLGVPRNFASDMAEMDSVYLYNIDDLAGIADENRALREAAAQDAELIIEYGLAQFERWRHKRVVQPEIVDLRAAVHEICATEVNRLLATQEGMDNGAVEHLAHAISQKIAHELTKLVEHRIKGESESTPLIIVPKG